MIWKRYQNELIVVIALLLMVGAYLYKQNQVNQIDRVRGEVAISIGKVGEIIALKNQWGNPNLSKKVKKIKKGLDESSIKLFSVKSKKLTASFVGLDTKEMNGVITKLENIAVQIVKLKVTSRDKKYSMEIKCKW